MRYLFALIFYLLTNSWATASERINIPQPLNSIKHLKDSVKEQTGYTLVIPFADTHTQFTKLPSRLPLRDVLNWICRYFEEHNDVRLIYEFRNRSIFFKNVDLVKSSDRKTFLAKKLSLKGKRMTIGESIEQARKRLNIKINIDVKDSAALKSDYNYRCSLAEFLDEVKHYYKSYNNIHITYGVEDNAIRFHQQGQVISGRLDVGLLPKQISTKKPKIDYPNIKPIRKHKIKKLQIKSKEIHSEDKAEATLAWLKAFDLEDYLKTDKLDAFLIYLSSPRHRSGKMKNFFAQVETFFKPLKGFNQFKRQLLSLDQQNLSVYEINQAIESLENQWVKTILRKMINLKHKQPHPGTFIYALRGQYNFGSGANKIGKTPLQTVPQDGSATWFELGASVEYHSDIKGLWVYKYKGHADFSFGSNNLGESMDHGSLAAEFEANRQVALLNLMSITPYFTWIHEDDIASKSTIQAHDLFLGGIKLHWYEKNNTMGYQQGIADSEFMTGYLIPTNQQKNSIISNEKRNSFLLGFIQHFALMNSSKNGYDGPAFRLGYILRSSDSKAEDGGEMLFSMSYLFSRDHWASTSKAEYSNWARDQKVDQFILSQEFSYSPWLNGEKFKLLLEYDSSSSDDAIMDYTSNRAGIGFEKTW